MSQQTQPSDAAIDNLAKAMETSKYNAGRLIMTESAYFSSEAQKDAYNKLGVEQFEILATLDDITSELCQSLDGKVFPMSEYQAGVTAPPFHPWCRTTTVPYFDDDFGERAAREPETEKTYYVSGNMKYPEWRENFVEKDLTQKHSGDIMLNRDINSTGSVNMTDTIKSQIQLPIEREHSGKGVPSAIIHSDTGLTNRQQTLLNQLPEYDSRVTVPKNSVSMRDLSALTAETGVEYAMFTKGQERLIIRGNEVSVNVSTEFAEKLSRDSYRWSGHTHPGIEMYSLQSSEGDMNILKLFNQKKSVIYNSTGNHLLFWKEE